ncbi:MAG: hypothetical protein LUD78_10965 [Clostridiales bacterium]|nr:hypothetical protein [Clostridiales bacterium]
MKREGAVLIIFALTAILGLIAAFAGIIVALFGGYTAGTMLLCASLGWLLEALIAGRNMK